MVDISKLFLLLVTILVLTKQSEAALATACTVDGDCTTGDSNSKCDPTADGDGNCVCVDTHKDDPCVPKVLGDPCGATSECVAVSQATCNTNCVCEGQYKTSGTACAQKVLGDTCAADGDCVGVSQATCNSGNSQCDCENAYKTSGASCVQKGLDDTCSADSDCSGVSNAVCDTADTNMCKCGTGYEASGSVCSDAVSVRASTVLFATMFVLALIQNKFSCTSK